MATAIWVIVVCVLISILAVSVLSYFLNRSYRKRRPLKGTENDLGAGHDRSSNSLIDEAQPALYSSKDLEAGHERPSNPSIKEIPPSLYSPEKAIHDLAHYQRYHRKRRPDYGESAKITTTPSGTIINPVPSAFFTLSGARPLFSFDPIHKIDDQSTPPPISLSTSAVIDFGSEEDLTLPRKRSTTACEPRLMQSAQPLRNGVRTLQSPRKSLPRAPRREIGSEKGLKEVGMIPVDVRVRSKGGNEGLRRISGDMDLRGKMAKMTLQDTEEGKGSRCKNGRRNLVE